MFSLVALGRLLYVCGRFGRILGRRSRQISQRMAIGWWTDGRWRKENGKMVWSIDRFSKVSVQ